MPFKARKAVFEKLEKIVDISALSKEEHIETARNLKKLGVSTTIIMQSTGLSEEEIEKL